MQDDQFVQECRNCQAHLPNGAKFCPQCSQRNHDGKLNFREMLSEIIATLFNLDNRIFRSLGAIFVPGKLTSEYFKGRHVRYYHPLRLFLFTGLALVSITTIKYKQGEAFKNMERMKEEKQRTLYTYTKNETLDSIRLTLNHELKTEKERQAVDTFAYRAGFLDSMTIVRDSFSFNLFGDKPMTVSNLDLNELSPDSLANKYKVTDYWERLFLMQMARAQKGANDFLLYVFGNIIWMLLLLIPIMALVLKLLYIRQPFFFYEHLVFMLHIHAAAFLMFFLVFSLPKSIYPYTSSAAMLLSFIYPFIALKKVYQQGLIKTFMKFSVLGFAYLFVAMILSVLLTIVSFAMF